MKGSTIMKKLVFFLFAVLLACNSAHANTISANDIEKFIKTYRQLSVHFNDHEEDDDDDDSDDIVLDVSTLKARFLESIRGKKALQAIIAKNGYPSVDRFAEQGAYILRAYMVCTGREGIREFEQQLSSMSATDRQKLLNSPTGKQIAQFKRQFATVPQAHIKAIEPYLAKLNAIF